MHLRGVAVCFLECPPHPSPPHPLTQSPKTQPKTATEFAIGFVAYLLTSPPGFFAYLCRSCKILWFFKEKGGSKGVAYLQRISNLRKQYFSFTVVFASLFPALAWAMFFNCIPSIRSFAGVLPGSIVCQEGPSILCMCACSCLYVSALVYAPPAV